MPEPNIYTGTAEELANNDILMAELHKLDSERSDLDEYETAELMAYIAEQNEVACTAQNNIRAAMLALEKYYSGRGSTVTS